MAPRTPRALAPTCPLCQTKIVRPTGLTLPYALVGDQPGWKEKMLGRPLVGETGELLAQLLRRYGYNLHEDFRLSNLWLHDPLDDPEGEPDWHLARLLESLRGVRAVLLMGSQVTAAVVGRKVSETAGLRLTSPALPGAVLMPCYNPAALFKNGSTVGEVYGPLEKFALLLQELERPTTKRRK